VDHTIEERRQYIFNKQNDVTQTGNAKCCLFKNALKLTKNI